jgi:glycosyl hydrolase family 65
LPSSGPPSTAGRPLFPWRTLNGQECSGYWPASTAAFHTNADIADAVVRYVDASGDEAFARRPGMDLLTYTARLWHSLGHRDAQGRFRIDGVTGPDEYSAVVDNNVYTNLMARQNLLAAAEAADRHPSRARELGIDAEEAGAWRDAAQKMFIPQARVQRPHPRAAGPRRGDPHRGHVLGSGRQAAGNPALRREGTAFSREAGGSPADREDARTPSARPAVGAGTRSPPTRSGQRVIEPSRPG